jgi:hypothetical protein
MVNSPKNNIVKNKKGIEYRKYSNDNEKYLYANYLVSLRKFRNAQKSLNYNIFTNIVSNNISNNEDEDNNLLNDLIIYLCQFKNRDMKNLK